MEEQMTKPIRKSGSARTPRKLPDAPEPPRFYVERKECTIPHSDGRTCAEVLDTNRSGGDWMTSAEGKPVSLAQEEEDARVMALERHRQLASLPTARYSSPRAPGVLKPSELLPKSTRRLITEGSTPRTAIKLTAAQLKNITSQTQHVIRYDQTDAARALQKERQEAYRSHHNDNRMRWEKSK